MLKISQYPQNSDGTPMDLEVVVITDATGNGGARLTSNPTGPDGSPIAAKGVVFVDSSGNPKDFSAIGSEYATRAAMAARPSPQVLETVTLKESGRFGQFIVGLAAAFTSAIAADAATQGRFVLSTADPTKVYQRIVTGESYLTHYGYVSDDANGAGTDNAPIIEAALATLKELRLTGPFVSLYGVGASVDLRLPFGAAWVSRRIVQSHTIRVSGFSQGIPGGSATQLRYPHNSGGWLIDHGSPGSTLENITFRSMWNPASAGADGDEGEFHAVEWKVPCTKRNLQGYNWRGDFLYDSNDAASTGGADNSNEDVTEDCFAQLCRNVYAPKGGDVNGKRVTGLEGISCRQSVLFCKSFLGNGYGVIRGEANGYFPGWVGVGASAARPACLTYHAGNAAGTIWACIGGNEVWCSTNAPPATGTFNQGWVLHPGLPAYGEVVANSFGIPTWFNGGFYRPGGGVIMQGGSNRSTIDFLYSESDQLNQFDINVGLIKGNADNNITVNTDTGTYFPTLKPPFHRGTRLDFSPTITGNLTAFGSTVELGQQIGSVTDLVVGFNTTNTHNLQFNRYDSVTGALVATDAELLQAFGTMVVQGSGNVRLRVAANDIVMATSTGLLASTDNTLTLGGPSNRFSTVYAGTGAINTSDERHKTNIGVIDDKVLDAWGDVEWCGFQYKDAVEAKGGDARLHVGLVAQRVKSVFERHGLDAFKYGLLCYDKWDEAHEPEMVEVEHVTHHVVEDGEEQYENRHGVLLTRPKFKVEARTTPRMVVKMGENGESVMKLTRSAGDAYGIRYSEAQALENAWMRRELARMRT